LSDGGQILSSTGVRRTQGGESLADVLDRVLDKGVVIAGDIAIALVGIELLTIKIRLLVASADKAREMGIDWWRTDPFLAGKKMEPDPQVESNDELRERIATLESQVAQTSAPPPTGRRTARPRR
jgi:hypothetical protein